MSSRCSFWLVVVSCFISAHINAQNMNLQLAPQQDKTITNNTLWTIHATCQIRASASKKTIRVHGLKNISHVNGKSLSAGQSTAMTVYDQKTIEVSAEPGAQVSITNLSNAPIAALCST